MLPAALAAAACACRDAGDRNGTDGPGVYTVRELQDYGHPNHPPSGTTVTVENVIVTAVDEFDEDGSGRVGSIWVGEPDETGRAVCGDWCGITVYSPSVVPKGEVLGVGDLVNVTGLYDEYLYGDDGAPPDPDNPLPYHTEHLSEISYATVFKTGEWLPLDAVEVDVRSVQMEPSTLQARERAEALEGVLVTVRSLTADSEYDDYGQFTTEEGVMIENDLYHYPCLEYTGDISGMHFDSITGVVTWFGIKGIFGDYKILPRGPGDISPAPDFPECGL